MKLIYLMDDAELYDMISTVCEWQSVLSSATIAEEFRSQDDIIWHNSELTAHGYDAFNMAYNQYYSKDMLIAEHVVKQKSMVLELCKVYKYMLVNSLQYDERVFILHLLLSRILDQGIKTTEYTTWCIPTKDGLLRVREFVDKLHDAVNKNRKDFERGIYDDVYAAVAE